MKKTIFLCGAAAAWFFTWARPCAFGVEMPVRIDSAKRPVIGLLYSAAQAAELPGKDALSSYSKAVSAAGGDILALSPLLSPEETAKRLASVNALLVPGGIDVSPELYGEKPHEKLEAVDPQFDACEYSALKTAVERGIPVLAICRGMQILNVFSGGSLYQDIPAQVRGAVPVGHRKRDENNVSQPCHHDVSVATGTLLGDIMGAGRTAVNSYHHQAVKRAAPGFAISAVADDGVIEGIEKGNILAVQFHPEKESGVAQYAAIFKWFISAALSRGGTCAGVKVCGINDKPSALAALSAAKESGIANFALGLLLGTTHSSREKISEPEAVELVRYIRATAYSLNVHPRIVCVTHLTDSRKLIEMVRTISKKALYGGGGLVAEAKSAEGRFACGDAAAIAKDPVFDIIQIHDDMPLAEIERVKQAFPGVKIMKAMHVPGLASKDEKKALAEKAVSLAGQPYIDALLLDSSNPAKNQIGGTGIVNDWEAARDIISAVHLGAGKPVALAGGINPGNAAAAIKATGADVLDANTGYRFDRPGGSWKPLASDKSAPKDVFAIFSVMKQLCEVRSDFTGLLFE